MQDRRKEFKKKYWQQGKLLDTRITREFSEEQRQEAIEREKECCFIDFGCEDEGRGRTFVYKYKTAKKCKEAIKKHNIRLTNYSKKWKN